MDLHTHLLPNIDDGVLKFDQIEKMLDVYYQADFSKIVCTPHLYNPYVRTNISAIKDTYKKVRAIAKTFSIDCLLGSEYYYSNQRSIVGIPIESRYQLIELATTLPPPDFIDKFNFVLKTGMKIILAHVERYPYLKVGSPDLEKLIDMGVLIQVNASAVASGKAIEFVETETADLISTDNHGNFKLPLVFLEQIAKYPYLHKRMEKIYL
jgi:protein-tyrosine phosphatase